ncbi:hypothetical protein [Pseudomonas mandelii]|uniref:hypothetical protein n=1 Tax=Pseudomonas mandelii TaxID=75612 RepID=UPI003C712AF7
MKIETIAQAKANARAAHDHHADLLRMQQKLEIEIPEAYARWQAANAITSRLVAQRGGADTRAGELAAVKAQIHAAQAGGAVIAAEPVSRGESLDTFINELTGA